jgi:DNA topoisomerase-1
MAKAKSLVVVESPAKATTINKILGTDFIVKSCMGHVRDPPPKELGIDVNHDFAPHYVTIHGKGKVLTELRSAANGVKTIYLATDPDREGEAIAWHVAHAIAPKVEVKRIQFNEITPKAVRASLDKSSTLDMEKVNAQQARRVLDRLVGYEISPPLWKVIHAGLSAGRVQSVALRIIAERDGEINAFNPVEYWSLDAMIQRQEDVFKARLIEHKGEKLAINDEESSRTIVAQLSEATFEVSEVKRREQQRRPSPPFITSTLQQECARRLRFSVKRTMAVAQQLYEGVDIGDGETRGLITYMRTDSVRVSDDAVAEARHDIERHYGAEYVPEKPVVHKTRRSAQDAHEAVRPTSVALHPEAVAQQLDKDQARLYELVWKRFVASQMNPQVLNITTVNIKADDYLLRATSSSVKFPGFALLYTESVEKEEEEEEASRVRPDLACGDVITLIELLPEQHFTKPPARYSEASLVKELEAKGIGRPSTYAQIISTLQDREYVEKVDGRAFVATERGQTVNKFLVATFPNIFDVAFTARMEDELDRIEDGGQDWVDTVRQFYDSWKGSLEDANERRKELKKAMQEETTVKCEECGQFMVVKWGRNGRFLACPGYPQCKNTKPLEEEEAQMTTDEVCDLCTAPMVVKTGRFGRFLACSAYPNCRNVKPLPLGIVCPEEECPGELVEKQSRKGKVFFGCTKYPDCKFASWDKPILQACPHCEAPMVYEKASRGGTPTVYCKVCETKVETALA